MTQTPTIPSLYESAFNAVQSRSPHGLLTELRRKAFDRFVSVGFPTTNIESWRFTPVGPILKPDYAMAGPSDIPLTPERIEPHAFGGPSAARFVFLDGHFRPDLTLKRLLPAGIRVMSLREALKLESKAVEQYLARNARDADDPFTALNSAFIEDGAFIHVDAGVRIDQPIHLLFLSTDGAKPLLSHPRNLIVAERGSWLSVIEHYAALGDDVYFSNAVTEVHVAEGAEVHHYLLDRESDKAFNISTLSVQQEKQSRFESHSALLGGAIVRNNVEVTLNGPGCDSLVNGLYLPRGAQHMDNHMRVIHAAPHCGSRQFYKGVLSDKAGGVFTGRIVVHEGAIKTDAKQTNRNLLLSDEAHVDTQPQLEIYADDVKCTHGATIGQIDTEAMFYFRARGISEDVAQALLIYAFAHESLERMTLEPVRTRLEKLLFSRLPGTEALQSELEMK